MKSNKVRDERSRGEKLTHHKAQCKHNHLHGNLKQLYDFEASSRTFRYISGALPASLLRPGAGHDSYSWQHVDADTIEHICYGIQREKSKTALPGYVTKE